MRAWQGAWTPDWVPDSAETHTFRSGKRRTRTNLLDLIHFTVIKRGSAGWQSSPYIERSERRISDSGGLSRFRTLSLAISCCLGDLGAIRCASEHSVTAASPLGQHYTRADQQIIIWLTDREHSLQSKCAPSLIWAQLQQGDKAGRFV